MNSIIIDFLLTFTYQMHFFGGLSICLQYQYLHICRFIVNYIDFLIMNIYLSTYCLLLPIESISLVVYRHVCSINIYAYIDFLPINC